MLAFFVITHCIDNARQKANLVFLGGKAPKFAYGEDSRCGLLENGPVRGTAPEANVFEGIKTPKKCI